jgi:hypothetical protein
LAHAIIISVAKLTNNPNYDSYHRGYKIIPEVQHLFQTTVFNVDNGAGMPEITRIQEHLFEYHIVVYEGLNSDQIMYDG